MTRKIYTDDWGTFCAWCAAGSVSHLPAAPETILAYLTARQATLGLSGLRVALAAIRSHHRQAGLPLASADPAISRLLSDMAQAGRSPVRPAAVLTAAAIERLVSSCDPDPGGRAAFLNLRDRALLLLCFAGGLRRSELVALDREDIDVTREGLTLRVGSSRPDKPVASLHVSRGTDAKTCAVQAMETWLRRARIDYGPVFPRLTAAGTIEARLTGNGVWKILRRRAALVGLEAPAGERLSPHGMRAGFIVKAYATGASDGDVMAHARQRDRGATRRYNGRVASLVIDPDLVPDI
ncbi:tyrosine-type recombinase/integrase [Acidisoma silvae]|uniref:Tyrosine-type recombinase/integrase n=1 Tax=Acidisoma silvae TaxID=2802396 RepID=A0A963YU19_9PROT|nr:tyrosine-type recombinase/integrase [Acidisoma silvae]MCB8877063.1 tyrosine-type recombinase/integrase [Acidisoma silvae]